MKASDLIAEICELAEEKFGVSGHMNDWIEVSVSGFAGTTWQASLVRPSKKQLDSGEIINPRTIKRWESDYVFYCEGPILMKTLRELLSQVEDVDTQLQDDDLAHFFRC